MTPLVIAHRGASAHAPENTLAAFRLALELGADGVEFDVRLGTDGVPVVIHDASLKRTAGLNKKVSDLTSVELGKIDVGSWFNTRHPKRANAEFAAERVPTLADVMQSLDGFRGCIYVELKCGHSYHPLVNAVADLLRGSKLLPRVIVASFRLAALAEMRQRLSDVRIAALGGPSMIVRRSRIIDLSRECGADQLSLHRSLVTAKVAALADRANMPMTAWTVDTPRWIMRARKLGIRALITNDPARMLAARDEDN